MNVSPEGAEAKLAQVRSEERSEIDWLHQRTNALVTGEAFLTIAYTAAMSDGAKHGPAFSALVGPVLAALGLVLALLAWPGVNATAKMVATWSTRQLDLINDHPDLLNTVPGIAVCRNSSRAQWRSVLFFRAIPGLFALVWVILGTVALVLR